VPLSMDLQLLAINCTGRNHSPYCRRLINHYGTMKTLLKESKSRLSNIWLMHNTQTFLPNVRVLI